MRFIFIRHGESENNIIGEKIDDRDSYLKQRSPDPSITQKGVEQAKLSAKYFNEQGSKIYKIFCSPQKRAILTALNIQECLEYKPQLQIIRDFHELGGNYDYDKALKGLNRSQFKEIYNDQIDIDEEIQENGWFFLEQKESYQETLQRAYKISKDILKRSFQSDTQENHIYICHGIILNFILEIFLKYRQQIINSIAFTKVHDNTGMTSFEIIQNEVKCEYINSTKHLNPFNEIQYINQQIDLNLKELSTNLDSLSSDYQKYM